MARADVRPERYTDQIKPQEADPYSDLAEPKDAMGRAARTKRPGGRRY
jgi:hypothetical protein